MQRVKKNTIFIGLVAIISLLIILVSPLGLKLSMSLVKRQISGLSYENISGSLIGNIHINQLNYNSKQMNFSAKHIRLRINLLGLLHQRIHLNQLIIQQAKLHINPIKTKHKTNTQQTPHSVLGLLQRLRVDNLKISPLIFQKNHEKKIVFQTIKSRLNFINTIQANIFTTMSQPIIVNNQFKITGSTQHYEFTNELKTRAYQLITKGDGSNKKILANFTINKQQGHGHISLNLKPTLSWHWNLALKQLKTSLINNQLPDINNISGSGSGTLSEFSNAIKFTLNHAGNIIHSTLSATRSNKHTLIQFTNTINNSYFNIRAENHKIWSGSWQASITDLSQWYAPINGSIQSEGTVKFKSNGIESSGSMHGHNNTWKNIKAKQTQLSWLFNTRKKIASLKSQSILIKQYRINQINLSIKGNNAHQFWVGSLKRAQQSLLINAETINNHAQWHINIKRWSLIQDKDTWSLKQPTSITITPNDYIELKPTCWHHNHQQLCGMAKWSPKFWRTHWSSDAFDTKILTKLLNQNLSLIGIGQFQLNARGNAHHINQLNMNASTGQSQLLFSNQSMKLKSAKIQMSLNQQQGLNGKISVIPSSHPELLAKLSMPTYFGHGLPSSKTPIKGRVKWSSELELFSGIIPSLAKPKGNIKINLVVGGNLQQPTVNGSIAVNKGIIDIPQFGIALNNITAKLNAQSKKMQIKALVYTQNQPIKINGIILLSPLTGKINIQAKQVLIWNTPSYQFIVTPKINLDINHQKINLAGDVLIDRGIVRPPNFNQVLTLPREIQFTGSGNWGNKTEIWPWGMNIHLNAGKQLSIDTMGIQGIIRGNINLNKISGQPILATGKLRFAKGGRFSLHNQIIKISSGTVVYAQSPLNNPLINIQANRTINNLSSNNFHNMNQSSLTVGAHITGHINNPNIRFYSTPRELSQGDILAYLVLGQTVSTQAMANLPILLDALDALRFGRSDDGIGLTDIQDEFQRNFGINELNIETQNTVDSLGNTLDYQTALVIGKSIGKKLYFRYNFGLSGTNPINSIQLRWYLSSRWFLQSMAETNNNNAKGLDLFYNIERN